MKYSAVYPNPVTKKWLRNPNSSLIELSHFPDCSRAFQIDRSRAFINRKTAQSGSRLQQPKTRSKFSSFQRFPRQLKSTRYPRRSAPFLPLFRQVLQNNTQQSILKLLQFQIPLMLVHEFKVLNLEITSNQRTSSHLGLVRVNSTSNASASLPIEANAKSKLLKIFFI